MSGFERGIADIFATLEGWLVSTGATQSMVRLAWAVLTFLWLGHVAASMRPGCPPDVVGTFGRLVVAGGLLGAVGSLNRMIVLAFEALVSPLSTPRRRRPTRSRRAPRRRR